MGEAPLIQRLALAHGMLVGPIARTRARHPNRSELHMILVVAISLVTVVSAFVVPFFVNKKFGPGNALAVGALGIVLLVAAMVRAANVGLVDSVALAILFSGAFKHYRAWEEARVMARGEAAVTAAEAARRR